MIFVLHVHVLYDMFTDVACGLWPMAYSTCMCRWELYNFFTHVAYGSTVEQLKQLVSGSLCPNSFFDVQHISYLNNDGAASP